MHKRLKEISEKYDSSERQKRHAFKRMKKELEEELQRQREENQRISEELEVFHGRYMEALDQIKLLTDQHNKILDARNT